MRPLLAVLALVVLALAACGGGEDDEGRTVTAEAGAPIPIAGDEYSFDPENVVVTGAPASIEIEFANDGALAHNVRVFKDGDEIGGSPTFQGGGRTRTATVQLRGPGEYELICTVGDHEELGMTGSLEVRE